jgi:hypothetical protein
LVIGILSFRSPVGLARRQWIRNLMRVTPTAAVRFVLSNATPDEDAGAADMLLLHAAESGRSLGTYLLTLAFFRHTLALKPRIPFIGRADDDSLFDPPTVLAELEAVGASAHVVYGPYHEWYQWMPRAMMPTCFAYSTGRFHSTINTTIARCAAAAAAAAAARTPNGTALAPPLLTRRADRECLYAEAVGPYPYAKGPLVVYTRQVLERLLALPQASADEAYALGARKRMPLRTPLNGRVLNSSSYLHPRRQVVFDDMYVDGALKSMASLIWRSS